ncbi:MAG: glycosyltransferase family protein [Cyclobacteriaceae bacterium]
MPSQKKRFVFLVQGEGRGHMTQAIVLYHLLTRNGHEVSCAFIGTSKRRKVPDYFLEQIKCPIYPLKSPNFVTDKDNRRIRLFSTILYNAFFIGRYTSSMWKMHVQMKKYKPDYFINFYDFLGGFFARFFRMSAKHVVIGHQFLAGHPSFPFAEGMPINKFLFKVNNYLTSLNAHRKIALSFMPYFPPRVGNIYVVPPLVRQEIKDMNAEQGNFLLGYVVNAGYGEEFIKWHANNLHIEMHCFWDNSDFPDEYQPHENLTMHQVSASKFLDYMRKCMGYVSTAGFESICEAMYLEKPVLMIPVEGQYEQVCNAIDAANAGAGIYDSEFKIDRLISYIPHHKQSSQSFKTWEEKSEKKILAVFDIKNE